MKSYDLIGDTHGYAAELRLLLETLGYRQHGGVYRHAQRQAVFLGDFVDRGPRVRETLAIARAMVEGGAALAVMGNHDYNALCYAAPDGEGGFLRPHTEKNRRQHEATLWAFEGREAEWAQYIEWLATLPLWLELDGLRVVHACWDPSAIRALDGCSRFASDLLAASGKPKTPRQRALNTLVKGPEMPLPDGERRTDWEGTARKDFRVRWWAERDARTYAAVAMPDVTGLPDRPFPTEYADLVCGYDPEEPPLFIGHYGFRKAAEPIRPNLACVDLGVVREGPLCAYRWDGERTLARERFVLVGGKDLQRSERAR